MLSNEHIKKWLKTKDILNNYELNRKDLGQLIIKYITKRKVMDIDK